MNNFVTKIQWDLNDFCKSDCSYCPIQLNGGDEPLEIKEYMRVANLIIDSYQKMNRSISWVFSGGEPLDMIDLVVLLKLCRTNGNHMELNTNGGKLWMDWWAIEPYVDHLNLTYHYWQNPALISYIIHVFKDKNKSLNVMVPIRPDYFEEDIGRALQMEQLHNIEVKKTTLYKNASKDAGMFNYTDDQLNIMSGINTATVATIIPKLIQEKSYYENTTWEKRYQDKINSNPSYSGQLCNVGIEYLNITHQGWVKGSNCNNQPLGNIWHDGWSPPTGPQICSMLSCNDESDRKITKFPN
jgi:MoaA/NifB/PqqE/SkfB family radical SAM enzyme